MNGQLTPFQFIWNGYNSGLTASTNAQVSASLSAVAGVIQGVLVIYVAIVAIMMIFGKVGGAEIQDRILRCLLVVALLTPALFNKWVTDLFMNQLPAWESTVVSGTTPGATMPQQFDQIYQAIDNMLATIRGQATGVYYIAQRIEVGIAGALINVVLAGCFIIQVGAAAMIALVLDIFPLTAVGFLFNWSRGVADRTLSKLLGLSLLSILLKILLQLVITQDQAYLHTMAAAGNGLDAMIQAIWNIFIVFLVGLFLMLMIPGVAVYICGGVSFSPMPVFMIIKKAVRGGK